MTIETVQDINRGLPSTSIISASGEIVDNHTGNARVGHKFSRELSTKEIAKLIRADYKSLGFTPKNGFKISVRSDSFAGGTSIDVRVQKMPFNPYSQDYINQQNKSHYERAYCEKIYTPHGEIFMNMLEHVFKSYNYSDCDGQIDYFHVNYYGCADLDWQLKDKFLAN